MKRLFLALIAATSLSLPALARHDTNTSPSSPSATSAQAQPNEISPEKLKSAQVHQLQ